MDVVEGVCHVLARNALPLRLESREDHIWGGGEINVSGSQGKMPKLYVPRVPGTREM